jgi:radical SAM protein with 4Fe4S-binding SPASM domain
MISDADYWNMFATSDYMPESCKGCKLSKMCDCGCREVANILHGSPKEKDTSIIA